MPTIIRATERNQSSHMTEFNFDDMSQRAERYLQHVKAEATKIVAEAQKEALAIRQRAEEEGRQAGRTAALAAVEQMIQKQLETVVPALRKVVHDVQDAKQAWLRRWEAGAIHVAAMIAEKVIRRELTQKPEITLSLVREALELSAGSSQLQIRLNPADLKALSEQVQTVINETTPLAETTVIADAEISSGGCRVETRFGVIDQQIETQLKRIEEELS